MNAEAGWPPTVSASEALVAVGTGPSERLVDLPAAERVRLVLLRAERLVLDVEAAQRAVRDVLAGDLQRGVAGAAHGGEQRRERDDESGGRAGDAAGDGHCRPPWAGGVDVRSTGPPPVSYAARANCPNGQVDRARVIRAGVTGYGGERISPIKDDFEPARPPTPVDRTPPRRAGARPPGGRGRGARAPRGGRRRRRVRDALRPLRAPGLQLQLPRHRARRRTPPTPRRRRSSPCSSGCRASRGAS